MQALVCSLTVYSLSTLTCVTNFAFFSIPCA